jgi:hypothetical protein
LQNSDNLALLAVLDSRFWLADFPVSIFYFPVSLLVLWLSSLGFQISIFYFLFSNFASGPAAFEFRSPHPSMTQFSIGLITPSLNSPPAPSP